MLSSRLRQHTSKPLPSSGEPGGDGLLTSAQRQRRFSTRKVFALLLLFIVAFQLAFFYASRQTLEDAVRHPEERANAFPPRAPHRDADGEELVDGLGVFKSVKNAVLQRASTATLEPPSSPSSSSSPLPPLGNTSTDDSAQDPKGLHDSLRAAQKEDKATTQESDAEPVGKEQSGALAHAVAHSTGDASDANGQADAAKEGAGKEEERRDIMTEEERAVGKESHSEAAATTDPVNHGVTTRWAARAVPMPVPLSSRSPYIRRAMPKPPTASPPPLLMPGGKSIGVELGVFTVVTAVWNSRSLKPLEELARSMHYAGLNNHTRFFEFLVYIAVSADVDVAEVRASVRAWWTDCDRSERATEAEQQPVPSDSVGLAAMLGKVRVVRQPLRGQGRHGQQAGDVSAAPATIVEAMRLVRSEFVIFNPVEDPLYLFPNYWEGSGGNRSDSSASFNHRERLLPVRKHVRTVMNIALQTMSNNAVVQDTEEDAPLVIDQTDFLRKDEVHAFRLQLYPSTTNTHTEVALAKAMDRRITQFLLMVVQDIERSLHAKDATHHTTTSGSSNTDVVTSTVKRLLESFPDKYEDDAIVDGLPKSEYGANTQYHCQRAPIYGVGIYVPSFFRSREANELRQNYAAAHLVGGAPPVPDGDETARDAAILSQSVTSLCEALLTSPIRMEDLRGQASFFARHVCNAWAKLTGQRQQTLRPPGLKGGPGRLPQRPSLFPVATARHVDLCESACSFDWLTALKNEQHFAERARHRRNALALDDAAAVATAGRSPLHAFARMVYTVNETEALGFADRFFPFAANATAALEGLRAAIRDVIASEAASFASAAAAVAAAEIGSTATLSPEAAAEKQQRLRALRGEADGVKETVSMKYVVQDQRHRRNKMKAEGDAEVLCFSSRVCGFTLQPTLYRTDWVMGNVLSRCLRHQSECWGVLGSPAVAADQLRKDPDGVSRRMMDKMARYLSTSGRWAKGEYKVCMTGGISVHDPNSLLHSRTADPFKK